ncbi:MAG: glycine cleavage T C-terminal barrel domain-containing protein, partial [Pseudomonadota bacterium]
HAHQEPRIVGIEPIVALARHVLAHLHDAAVAVEVVRRVESLQRRKDNPMHKLVGLELVGDEIAAHGDCVHIGRQQIGVITSGTKSPVLSKNIALCRIAIDHSEPGTEVEVGKLDGHQKRLQARVVSYPFYDPDKSRVRA